MVRGTWRSRSLASWFARRNTQPRRWMLARLPGLLARCTPQPTHTTLETSANRLHQREDDLLAASEKLGGHLFETTIRLSVEVSHHQPLGDSPRFSGESDCRPDRANRRRAGTAIATENAATMETVQWGRSGLRCSGSRGDIISAYRGSSEPDANASVPLIVGCVKRSVTHHFWKA